MLIISLVWAASAADIPDKIELTSSKDWVVANNYDSALITAQVMNVTNNSVIPGVAVQFYVINTTMGSITPVSAITGADGKATATLTTKIVSGNASIIAYLTSNPSLSKTLVQKIDHGEPYVMMVNYNDQVSVSSTTTIIVSLYDKYGNRIDLKRDAEGMGPQVRFKVASPGSNATFLGTWLGDEYDGVEIYPESINGLHVNGTGEVAIDLIVSSLFGDNIVTINPLCAIPDRFISIRGDTRETIPAAMDIMVNPTVLYQPADGKSKFSITYTMFDKDANRLNGKDVLISAVRTDSGLSENLGSYEVTTTAEGGGVLSFGPKDTPMLVTLTARSQDNPNVTGSSIIEFYEIGPAFLGLTAMPDIMPSRDVSNSFNASVMAKVTDRKSNPVSGIPVNFRITPLDYPDPEIQTSEPFLGYTLGTTSITGTTNEDGVANTIFAPGLFNSTSQQLQYGERASANCTLTAEAAGLTQDHILNWKNFPFISVETEVSASNVTINDTIDITIKIRGEGMSISMREPMDVVLATSRARSMLEEEPSDRMILAYTAERLFIDQISQTKPYVGTDQIGLLTFGGNPKGVPDILAGSNGWSKGDAGDDGKTGDDAAYVGANYLWNGITAYNDFSTWEVLPTSDMAVLRAAIPKTVPFGGTSNQNEMPFRRAMYDAITQLRGTQNSNKAIVALVDSDITDYGDVLARGNAGNKDPGKYNGGTQSYYPFDGPDPAHKWADNDQRQNMAVYAQDNGVKIYIIYAAKQLNNHDQTTLQTLAQQTGGLYNYTGNDPNSLSNAYSWIAASIMRDAAVNATMTIDMGTVKVNQANIVQNTTPVFGYVYEPGISTVIKLLEDYNPVPLKSENIDQTEDYKDYILSFYVGTVQLHQTWQAKYRLRTLMTGDIDIFGNGSVIKFENLGSDISYQLPSVWIQVPIDKTTKHETYDLTINNFLGDAQADAVALDWSLTYSDVNATPDVVQAKIYYLDRYGNMKLFHTYHGLAGSIYIPNNILPPSTEWKFRLIANAPHAPTRVAEWPTSNTATVPEAGGGASIWPFGSGRGSMVLE